MSPTSSLLPAKPLGAGDRPLKDQHLKNVLDPLSAVMALFAAAWRSRAGAGSIFDGKQRFDLLLSPRGQRRITEARPPASPASRSCAACATCRSPATR